MEETTMCAQSLGGLSYGVVKRDHVKFLSRSEWVGRYCYVYSKAGYENTGEMHAEVNRTLDLERMREADVRQADNRRRRSLFDSLSDSD